MVLLRVPATTANLGPGFDTLGMALNLYNYLEFTEIEKGLLIIIDGAGANKIPIDKSNLAYQAAKKVFARVGYQPKGLKITLKNYIPLARGLGSSASVIVGGMVAANILAGEKLTTKQLIDMASRMEGHPDNVAPALIGGLVVSAQLDNELIYRKIELTKELACVVAVPEYELSTTKARSVLPGTISLNDAVFNMSRTGLLVYAFLKGDYALLGEIMEDRMHQPYRISLIPGMKEAADAAKRANALAFALSGAGPSVVAFCSSQYQNKVGLALQNAFVNKGISCKTLYLSPRNIGVEISEEERRNINEHNCSKVWRQLGC